MEEITGQKCRVRMECGMSERWRGAGYVSAGRKGEIRFCILLTHFEGFLLPLEIISPGGHTFRVGGFQAECVVII